MPSASIRQNLLFLPVALVTVFAAVSTSSAARNPGQHGPQAPSNIAAPAVTGQATVGATLAAAVGSWSGSSISYGIAWQRCDASGTTCVPFGVSTSTYVVQAADAGARLRVAV